MCFQSITHLWRDPAHGRLAAVDTRVAVALDVADGARAGALAAELAAEVGVFKIGLELFTREGPGVVRAIAATGARIFLDLKYHDIPNTVERAVAAAAALPGVAYLTVHAAGGSAMLAAAVRARDACGPQAPALLGVTVLTSLDESDLQATGVPATPRAQTLRLARLALDAGLDGLVCSADEVAALRAAFGPGPLLVVPGIRPEGSAPGDQKRTATPATALRDGASLLVVGRPITGVAVPRDAARALLRSLP